MVFDSMESSPSRFITLTVTQEPKDVSCEVEGGVFLMDVVCTSTLLPFIAPLSLSLLCVWCVPYSSHACMHSKIGRGGENNSCNQDDDLAEWQIALQDLEQENDGEVWGEDTASTTAERPCDPIGRNLFQREGQDAAPSPTPATEVENLPDFGNQGNWVYSPLRVAPVRSSDNLNKDN